MTQSWNAQFWKLGLASSFVIGGVLAYSSNFAVAQIIGDATLGAASSVITPTNINSLPSDRIEGGARRDTNLFHSFQEFNVGEGRGAYFISPTGIENIVSRVTGNNPSVISGKLGVLGSNANLFLINPKGIIFGANASLDVRSSFVATTANAIQFGNQGFFNASVPNTPGLLTINPSALLFKQVSDGFISNNSIVPAGLDPSDPSRLSTIKGLRVPDGRSLLLVGGNVRLEGGGLNALGGRVELGGLAGVGTVGLDVDANNLRLSLPDDVLRADVYLTDGATVNTSGNRGGDIQVHGRRVMLTNGSRLLTTTLGLEPGGNLTVTASESVQLIGRIPNSFNSGLFSGTIAIGNAGDITITTRKLLVQDGASILTSSEGADFGQFIPATGRGGNLTVTASDSVELLNGGIFAATAGLGDAGNVKINTGRLLVQGNRAVISVSSTGRKNAGNLRVTAPSINLDRGTLIAETVSGEGGNIILQAQNVLLQHQGNISTNAGAPNAPGDGGKITINTDTLIGIDNSDITANAFNGKGGVITINTQGIFGLEVRNTNNISELGNNNTSDISASSQKDPSLNGEVEINRPENDPSSGLVALPAELVDVSGLIAQGCSAGGGTAARESSKFIATGRGGLPPTPTEALRSDPALADLGMPVQSEENRASAATSSNLTNSKPTPLVEAQGWMIGSKGEVVLIAQAPTVTPHLPWLPPTSCNGS